LNPAHLAQVNHLHQMLHDDADEALRNKALKGQYAENLKQILLTALHRNQSFQHEELMLFNKGESILQNLTETSKNKKEKRWLIDQMVFLTPIGKNIETM
jgi:hypothetical protein